MAKAGKRPIAVFNHRKLLQIGSFILEVQAIVLLIEKNPALFVSPSPGLASVKGHLNELKGAETVALTKVTGGASARDLKYTAALTDVHGLQNYVQNLADAAADIAQALIIITSSGFKVKGRSARVKPPLAAKYGKVSGSILLIARGAGKRDFHEWAMSNNANNWTHLPSTTKAKTEVSSLTRLTTVYFRHRVITKDGPKSWSQPVNIVVL